MSTFKSKVLTILEDNKNKKVSSIIELIEELNEGKSLRQKTYIMTKDNKPFAIFCYYHKQWELVDETVYGLKSSSKTGLNTMCKLGTNKWTKQQKDAKKQEAELLSWVIDQSISIEEAETMKKDIETNRQVIDNESSIGYTLEEITELLNA